MADNDFTINPIKVQNPVDLAESAARLRDLSQQAQERQIETAQKQRSFDDDTTLRQAAQQSVVKDPVTGMPVIDRGAYIARLSNSSNPLLAPKADMAFRTQDMEKFKANQEMKKDIVHSISDQSSYDDATQRLAQVDPNLAKNFRASLGDIYNSDPNSPFQTTLGRVQRSTMSAAEQADYQHKMQLLNEEHFGHQASAQQAETAAAKESREAKMAPQEMAVKQAEVGIKQKGQQLELAKLNREIAQHTSDKQQEANNQFSTAILASRDAPDVKTSIGDHLQAQKFHEALKDWLDDPSQGKTIQERLDKVPILRMKLAMTEAAKMSKGGPSTEGEFLQMLPDTTRTDFQSAMQKLSGNERPAKVGSFLADVNKYVNDLDANAQNTKQKAYMGVLAQHARYMHPDDVTTARGETFEKFMRGDSAPAVAAKSGGDEHSSAIAAARDPSTPGWTKEKAAKILQINGLESEAAAILKGKQGAKND